MRLRLGGDQILAAVEDGVFVEVIDDALANSICHPRVLLSGIHDFHKLEPGFPIKNASGMTNCECIIDEKAK